MWFLFCLIGVMVGLFYWFLIWNFNYWIKRGIAGPKPKLFVGNFPNAMAQKRHTAYDLDEIYRKYKHEEDFVGIFSLRSPQLLILSPTFCRRVFVNDFSHFHDNEASTMVDKKSDYIFGNNPFVLTGEEWKEKRALLTPGLTTGRIKTVYPITNKTCRKMSEYLQKQIKMAEADGIDAKDLSIRFTTEVVTDCVLGLDADSFSEKPTPILDMINGLFNNSARFIFYMIVVSFIPALKTFWKVRFVPNKIALFFTDLMQNAINIRKSDATQKDRIDFLNYMLQLQEKKNIPTTEVTGNTMTFLIDGFETTGSVIAHCLLLLARYPGTQERLRDEINANIDENGLIDFDKLSELSYLDACIHESLRMFPPAFASNRICTKPIVLTSKSGRSVKIEKGNVIVVPLYSLMMDEEFYPNPQEFQPERFLEENGHSVKEFREKGVYMGFSDGPRVCIGMRFALTQTKAALVEILKNFKIRVNPTTRTDNLLDPKYFLSRLEGGIFLDFEALS